jgi:hypothetical protein
VLLDLHDEFEVLRCIVDMACSDPDSTIEDHELRLERRSSNGAGFGV